MSALAGRHALVTGGGTGIGAAIALTLAQAGAAVTICGRRLEPLQAIAAGDANIRAVAADVTYEKSVAALYERAETAGGPFDIVVANAGMAESAPASKISLELWNRTMAVNLTGAFLTVKPALAVMRARGWGRIVFIASTAGLKGYAYVAPYVAAKHGVIGLMRALALETANCRDHRQRGLPGLRRDRRCCRTRSRASSTRPTAAGPRRAPRSPRTIRKDGSSGRRRSPTPCCGCAATPARRSPARRFRCREARHGERSIDRRRAGIPKARRGCACGSGCCAPRGSSRARRASGFKTEFNATLPRFDVMAALYRKPDGMLMSELSRFLLVSNGNVTGIVDRLVSDGFVVRVAARRRPPHLDRAADRRRAARPSPTWRRRTKAGSTGCSATSRAREAEQLSAKLKAFQQRMGERDMTSMAALKPAHFLWRMEDDVAVIRLDRPERKNPLTFEAMPSCATPSARSPTPTM